MNATESQPKKEIRGYKKADLQQSTHAAEALRVGRKHQRETIMRAILRKLDGYTKVVE